VTEEKGALRRVPVNAAVSREFLVRGQRIFR
jgi:hypothetical protein